VAKKKSSPLREHSLSLVAAGILVVWIVLYRSSSSSTHWGSFFGNAIADWSGVFVTVVATKYFYERGSAESKRPPKKWRTKIPAILENHSLTILLIVTGVGWLIAFARMEPGSKWGQVVGNILSEWVQLLGVVLLTKRFFERGSAESRRR